MLGNMKIMEKIEKIWENDEKKKEIKSFRIRELKSLLRIQDPNWNRSELNSYQAWRELKKRGVGEGCRNRSFKEESFASMIYQSQKLRVLMEPHVPSVLYRDGNWIFFSSHPRSNISDAKVMSCVSRRV